MDSGATVTVRNPKICAAYQMVEGPAAKAGTMYEIADGTFIPNLGEKTAAVVNVNGTIALKSNQCANVSHNLTAVRQEMKANKTVIFDNEGCFTFKKVTGEVTPIDDDGVNFTQDEWVIPPEHLAQAIHESEQGFTRPAP
jgi:hypothetical protein